MQIKIVIEPFNSSNKADIASKWQYLEYNSNCSVFLSWQWIGNWLDLVTDKVFLVEAYREDEIVGLGFFVEKTRKVFRCFSIKQWWLHRTGIQQQDQIWLEYNDFLLNEACSVAVRGKMIKAIADFDQSVKEVIIGLSASERIESFTRSFTKFNFLSASIVKAKGYLAALSCSKEDYLRNTLSKNTRGQVSRSKKLLQSQGALTFKVVSEPEKLVELYPKIASIHIDKWQTTNEGSGFSNSVFESFHKSIALHNTNEIVQVAVLMLNEEELGYLVNFVYNNKVYFYLSALQQSPDNKIKIGLTLHSEAIRYYAEKGIESYDFLGGDARYKQSLSNQKYGLEIKCFYRSGFLLRFEYQLKNLKMSAIQMFSKYFK
ncbi:MAG: GNAT family N-acetyltransferase [Colwellia sp.]|nr:GNAT family N-acetyltransferase [Colwellia sp.]